MVTQNAKPITQNAFQGPAVVMAASVCMALMLGIVVNLGGTDEESARMAIRATARTSVFFFLAAFVAAALRRRWPHPLTTWLLRNRRYLGLSFALSHGLHALAIATLWHLNPEKFWAATSASTWIFGGPAFVFTFLMAITSTNAMMKRLGANWKRLHTVGMYYIWFIFFATLAPEAGKNPIHAVLAVLMLMALGARFLRAPTTE